jgi:hypothetical protein
MFRRVLSIIGVLAATGSFAASAAADPPLPPQAAPQAHEAIAGLSHQVSIAEARAAAHRPGAVTEGSLPETSRSLQRRSDTDGTICVFASPRDQWGTWPEDKVVYQNTYWCFRGGLIAYRSTTVTLSSTLCTTHNPYQFRVDGGVGYSTVTVQGGGSFTCPTPIPWVNLNYNEWSQWQYANGGLYAEVNWS